MLSESENKMMDAAEPKDGVTFKASSGVMYDFFFPGGGKWKPVTVRAESREVAQKLWEEKREAIAEEKPVETKTPNE